MKLAPLSHAIRQSDDFEEFIVHTGQHYDPLLSDVFFREFDLPDPRYHLGSGNTSQCMQIGMILVSIDGVLLKEKPDIVFVYGDTNSTAAGAIAAATHKIPVAHIEAGLREWNKSIPEEVNKLLTDAVSDLYFCPTQTAVENLARSGIHEYVYLVGDPVIGLLSTFRNPLSKEDVLAAQGGLNPGAYVFLTCHRAANTDNVKHLAEILRAAGQIDMPVIFPMHPRTRNAMEIFGLHRITGENIRMCDPLGFWETQHLIANARHVITDSGGVIKEAYYYRRPCIIIDTQTEWVEAVEEGWAVITGPDTEAILNAYKSWKQPEGYSAFLSSSDVSQSILAHVHDYLQGLQSLAMGTEEA